MRVEFMTLLRTDKLDGDRWRLALPFKVDVVIEPNADTTEVRRYVVPKGYTTDFASVPRLPLAYLIAGNRAHKAAVLHDYLYEQQAGRDFADQVFLAAMQAEGVPSWVARLMYWGVRVGGESRYGERAEVESPPAP